MRDNLRNLQVVHLGNVTLNGTDELKSGWVDLRGFNSCTIMVVANVIADAGTASGFTARLRDAPSAADAGAADVAAADTPDGTVDVTSVSDADDNKILAGLGYIGGKRFVGVNIIGTTLSDAAISIYAILGRAGRQPTTFVGAVVART